MSKLNTMRVSLNASCSIRKYLDANILREAKLLSNMTKLRVWVVTIIKLGLENLYKL